MARWPHEPVRGTWCPVAYCQDCGATLWDHMTQCRYHGQHWGEVDFAHAPDLDHGAAGIRCRACGKVVRAAERRKKAERERGQRVRNCVVCGDPFVLWTKLKPSKTGNMTCARPQCRQSAERAFDQAPYKGIQPRSLRDRADTALYCGEIHLAHAIYATCELLRFGRGIGA